MQFSYGKDNHFRRRKLQRTNSFLLKKKFKIFNFADQASTTNYPPKQNHTPQTTNYLVVVQTTLKTSIRISYVEPLHL